MTRAQAIPYVSYVVDDAGSGRALNADPHAIVRSGIDFSHRSILIGWQCGFEPLFVAVHSYLDCHIDDDEAEELAKDYLSEIGWFGSKDATDPDYIVR